MDASRRSIWAQRNEVALFRNVEILRKLGQGPIFALGSRYNQFDSYPSLCLAAMISSNDLRPGVSIEIDGAPWKVVEFLHVKPGKGAAFVRTKLKNMQNGNVVEKTFRAGESVPSANIEKADMQYLYPEGEGYVFMDMETYEQSAINADQIGGRVKYLKENMEVAMVRWNDQIIDVELPNTVTLQVTETDPGVKGDTATGGTKPAKLETGAEIQVPLFIKVGEMIRVDTRTDSYLGRESS